MIMMQVAAVAFAFSFYQNLIKIIGKKQTDFSIIKYVNQVKEGTTWNL